MAPEGVATDTPVRAGKPGHFVLSRRGEHLLDGAAGQDVGATGSDAEAIRHGPTWGRIGDVGDHRTRPVDLSVARQAHRFRRGDRLLGTNVAAPPPASLG